MNDNNMPGQGSGNNQNGENELQKPQAVQTQQNSQRPVEANQQDQSQDASKQGTKNPTNDQERIIVPYEKRFREFVKKKFGGIIGEMLLDNELAKFNVEDMSRLTEDQQIQAMKNVLEDIFKKHSMKRAEAHTKVEMFLQLSIDKAIEILKGQLTDDIGMSYIEVVHQNENKLKSFSSVGEDEKYWDITGTVSGGIEGEIDLVLSEKESIMQITEFAKLQNQEFNPLDEKQKKNLLFRLLGMIFDAYLGIATNMLSTNISYKLDEIKELDIDRINNIIKEANELSEKKAARTDITSAEFTVTIDGQDFNMLLFITY